ncbi:AAA family ATPase [candidate division WWE3 bacterium CG_4_9_14_0_2_um_filter_35_11]|uniref:AAA family ATPase n=1 Tax=candidate division WWE3 bacterium CG_4_9_14_0_2_um_filter_35_11 TaxID=1975077 RepID=A0A2M8ELY6_UNCKA|nr:MAG: AAA family ATPase [candidate division WWE3 bacterium CG10_big_fil_rev_8_21_14_0_10_35_32]PJC23756.1 MAG: AAA family ATPase [candidate division WWE3 bacterium CG_4_9_14_0_2_um_filter_35_11]
MDIQLSNEFTNAINLIETSGRNIFITGNAGTGKSTLLNYFTKVTNRNFAVLAPTGVAALNVSGQTIHSFFGFKPDVTINSVKKVRDASVLEGLDILIIDEISMVRADLFDCMEKALRINRKSNLPFGGVQIVVIGDLNQLPPVVTRDEEHIFSGVLGSLYDSPYFFSSESFKASSFEVVVLTKVYRQNDNVFLSLLNAVRNDTLTEQDIYSINARVDPEYIPDSEDFTIHLTTTNRRASELNEFQLSKVAGEVFNFKGSIVGSFDTRQLPVEEIIALKIGAQVMMLNNDRERRWVNGSLGKITNVIQEEDFEDIIEVLLDNGEVVEVNSHTWDIFRYEFDKSSKKLVASVVGSYTQYPMKLAWAVTIHKSQGKTFDRVVIDTDRGIFAHGQLYVALSRCRTLDGIILRKPITKRDLITDSKISLFMKTTQNK